jgi:hypothetical protein
VPLRQDLDAATKAAGGRANQGLDGNGGWTTVVPVDDGSMLHVRVGLALSGQSVSFVAPLAELVEPEPELVVTLLRRNAEADHTDGAAYALVSEEEGDLVAATYHWILPSVTPSEFAQLLKGFAGAVRVLRNDLADMRDRGAPLRLIDGSSLDELLSGRGPESGGS